MKTSMKLMMVTCTLTSAMYTNAQNVSGTATVTVRNSLTLAQTTALNFGTIRASADTTGTEVASIKVPADRSSSIVTQGSTGAA